jgi:hypothetical protein
VRPGKWRAHRLGQNGQLRPDIFQTSFPVNVFPVFKQFEVIVAATDAGHADNQDMRAVRKGFRNWVSRLMSIT